MATRSEDLDFMPDVYAATLRRGSRMAYVMTFVILLFMVVFFVWSYFAILDEVTRGDGRVIPSSKTQVIQNLEGGILADILVQEGDIVEPGDILVRIDNSVAKASFRDARSQFLSLTAAVARLEAEMEEHPLELPENVSRDAPSVAADEQALYDARQSQFAAEIAILESQINQRRQEVAEAESRESQLRRSLSLANQELKITKPLVDRGLSPTVELIRLQREVADLDGQLKTIRLAIPRLKSAVEESLQRVDEQKLKRRAEISRELNRTRAELKSVSETLLAGEDRVTRTEVRSQVRGTIKELKHNTLGGVIRPGEDIIEIVPLDDSLLIEARIRPADIAFLRPGQEAIIKIAAYDFSIYGGLQANLERISADTIRDEQGESYYRVYLRTKENAILRHGSELPIIPGMTATVEILTGQKSVLDYILKPIRKARYEALRER